MAPRPIGWIGSKGKSGVQNLAPYSYFNAVADKPHFVMFSSVGIKDSVKNIPHYYYDNIGDNPYYAFLGASNVALVTPDSVNMISETITANLSTYIFDLKCRSKRINKFLRKLEEENFVKKINGKINEFNFKENNATKEIADHLAKLI